jgi:hypothetical protein
VFSWAVVIFRLLATVRVWLTWYATLRLSSTSADSSSPSSAVMSSSSTAAVMRSCADLTIAALRSQPGALRKHWESPGSALISFFGFGFAAPEDVFVPS